MHDTGLDKFDCAILNALQRDGSLTNARLGEIVHLSASQCSRRRTALEKAGYIEGYRARLNPEKLGYGLRAITRVNLNTHGEGQDTDFIEFMQNHPQIRAAFSVSGDADYVLYIEVHDLRNFADFIHTEVLPHALVRQVKSEIILRTLKSDEGLELEA